MPRRLHAARFGLICFLGAGGAGAQATFEQGVDGGWGIIDAPREHISEAEQQALWQTIQSNLTLLRLEGRLPTLTSKAVPQVRFAWPTRLAPGRPEFSDHVVNNYIDHDPAVDAVRDYNCGQRTYDTSVVGGGHKGTDIGIGHRSFYKMDTEQVLVVAAAAGIIVARDDTHPDRSCGDLSTLFASTTLRNNVISLRHADGTVTIYYHVKTGSLTPKPVGATVSEGEYLAVVGSAGFSSGPHLHFEVRDAANAVIDPWVGACNPTTTVSLWKEQEPYRLPDILSLMPTTTLPSTAVLGTPCTDNIADAKPASGYPQPDFHPQPGVAHNFIVFLRDTAGGDVVRLRLLRPDASQYSSTSVTASAAASAAYFFTSRTLPASEPAGQWTFEASFAGKTRTVPFFFGAPAPAPARVYEFYNASLDHYFRTAAQAEADSLTPASGFLPTGDDYLALDRAVTGAGVSPVCRFYGSVNPGPNSHFYTADPAECAALQAIQAATPASDPRWNYEETAFAAYLATAGGCPHTAPFPVYRLYNTHRGEIVGGKREDSNHRFTTLSSVYNRMLRLGWSGEGVVMCAGSKP